MSAEGAGDHLGLALGGLGFGIAVGAGTQAVVTLAVRTLQAKGGGPISPAGAPPDLGSAAALVLLLGTLAGLFAAAIATWTLLAPLRNPWRQGMLGMVAAFGSFVLSLLAIPLDRWLGRPGLLGLAGLAFGAAALIGASLSRPREAR